MKILFASDIHGSARYCRELVGAYRREGADALALLGDILYHGPRNPLPDEYNPAEVAKILGGISGGIICVRGNCDSEVDQMVLPFDISSDYALIFADGVKIHLSHGHREVPNLGAGDIYITGHTHTPLNADEGFIHLNPGSVSLPKEGTRRGYIVYEKGVFVFKDLNGAEYDRRTL